MRVARERVKKKMGENTLGRNGRVARERECLHPGEPKNIGSKYDEGVPTGVKIIRVFQRKVKYWKPTKRVALRVLAPGLGRSGFGAVSADIGRPSAAFRNKTCGSFWTKHLGWREYT